MTEGAYLPKVDATPEHTASTMPVASVESDASTASQIRRRRSASGAAHDQRVAWGKLFGAANADAGRRIREARG